jgi:hypothetical protein
MAHHAAVAERHEPKLDPTFDSYDYPVIAPAPQNGHPGYTTEIQEAQVTQLRMMLEQEGYKDNLDTLTLVCALGIFISGVSRILIVGAAEIFEGTEVQCRAFEEDVWHIIARERMISTENVCQVR